jgi:hypothetical protein
MGVDVVVVVVVVGRTSGKIDKSLILLESWSVTS